MLTIEIVSDIVCPWCFIGTRRLAAAVALVRQELPDFRFRKHWLPFFLNPDTPPEGEPYLPCLANKFGGRDHSTVIHAVRLIEDLRTRDADMDGDVRSLLRQLES